MNTYENAPATRMLATNCVCCGRPLVDAVSVQMGIGPECRLHDNDGIPEEVRKLANEYIFHAAIAAQTGKVEDLFHYTRLVRQIGLNNLADKMSKRFVNAEKNADITIAEDKGMLRVETPFRRGAREGFVNAWRQIPGRRWMFGANHIPMTQKAALHELLRTYFPNKYVKGPKGVFRLQPMPETAVQVEMSIVK